MRDRSGGMGRPKLDGARNGRCSISLDFTPPLVWLTRFSRIEDKSPPEIRVEKEKGPSRSEFTPYPNRQFLRQSSDLRVGVVEEAGAVNAEMRRVGGEAEVLGAPGFGGVATIIWNHPLRSIIT